MMAEYALLVLLHIVVLALAAPTIVWLTEKIVAGGGGSQDAHSGSFSRPVRKGLAA